MVWLILILQLSRAAPRQRRRVSRELDAAGAVGISNGVWAVPDTPSHRSVVKSCSRRAVKAGGDLIIMNTSPENAPTHEFLEAALTEHLTAEAAELAGQYADFLDANLLASKEESDVTALNQVLSALQTRAARLAGKNVMGLVDVNEVVGRVREAVPLIRAFHLDGPTGSNDIDGTPSLPAVR